ncbi:MAG TPA: hypothetical protein VHX20_14435 [Terracidiphilus sp.]|nr:hypothetical protein [Terracidiphilus sp.]
MDLALIVGDDIAAFCQPVYAFYENVLTGNIEQRANMASRSSERVSFERPDEENQRLREENVSLW